MGAGGGDSISTTNDNRTWNYQGGSNNFSNFFGNFNYKGSGYFNSSNSQAFDATNTNKNDTSANGGGGGSSGVDIGASVGVGVGGTGSAGAVDKVTSNSDGVLAGNGNNSILVLAAIGIAAAFIIANFNKRKGKK
ncbi:MAG: hypothetical protein K2P17_03975 [Helicobacteraceae bacterium]|nr:hypothetical protein [Helicobacteraceae bacterium]